MLDAIVQLLRNGLCCIKDLGLLQNTFLWDPKVTLRYYELPPPLDQTTPLEVMISVWQFYAFFSTSQSGWHLFWSSVGKYRRIDRLMKLRQSAAESKSTADRLVNASLIKEAMYALRSIFVGFNVFFIGVCFLWLAANSWHITQTNWIGGVAGLIYALAIMEVCLVPLLWYMYKDGNEQMAKAQRMESLANKIIQDQWSSKDVGLSSLEALTGWLPYWDSGTSFNETSTPKVDEQNIAAEKVIIEGLLDDLGIEKKTKGEKEEKISKEKLRSKADELLASARVTRWEGYREYIYLVINTLAFYGYLLGIVVWVWDDEQNQPQSVRALMLGMENESADWHGNFLGDLMWTIEPVIILASPSLFQRFKPKSTKLKTA